MVKYIKNRFIIWYRAHFQDARYWRVRYTKGIIDGRDSVLLHYQEAKGLIKGSYGGYMYIDYTIEVIFKQKTK